MIILLRSEPAESMMRNLLSSVVLIRQRCLKPAMCHILFLCFFFNINQQDGEIKLKQVLMLC